MLILTLSLIVIAFGIGVFSGWFFGHEAGVKTIQKYIQDICNHDIRSNYEPNHDGWPTERKCVKCGKKFDV